MMEEIKDLVSYKVPEVPTAKDNLWRRILAGDFPDGNAYGRLEINYGNKGITLRVYSTKDDSCIKEQFFRMIDGDILSLKNMILFFSINHQK